MSFIVMLVSAFGIGALHALEPGHGKSIMGAYLVLSRGRPIHAVALGLTSAITHTLVIVTMSLISHGALNAAVGQGGLPEQTMETWLKIISGVIITFIGLKMAFRRRVGCSCHHGHNSAPVSGTVEWPTLILLGFTNGLIPCPSALAVLLMSISAGALFSGLVLVVAFGIGGAVSLIAIGLVFLKISHRAGHMFSNSAWSRLANVSGLLIAGIGFFTCYGGIQAIL